VNHRALRLLACSAVLASTAPCAAQSRRPSSGDVRSNAGGLDAELGMPGEELAKVALTFVDALSGNPIPGATATLEGVTVTTDDSGQAVFPKPAISDAEERTFGLLFEKDGRRIVRGDTTPERDRAYVRCKIPVHFMLGTVFNPRFSVSPALQPGKLRIVLDWGTRPADLDLHLIRQGLYEISFRAMRNYQDQAFLDRDAMTGLGPETVTIEQVDPQGEYLVWVHDYTDQSHPESAELSRSKARVTVFDDAGVVQAVEVPRQPGVAWLALSVSRGQVSVVNQVRASPPSGR
jgi:hypothetical protein